MDGTVVDDGGQGIPIEIFDPILKLREKGIQFIVASGRHRVRMECLLDFRQIK